MPHPVVVGVAVHRQTNTVWLLDRAGQVLGPRRTIANNRPGAEAFVRWVTHQVAAGDCDAIQIAAEATGCSWWHCFQPLDRAPGLQPWPLQRAPLTPRLTANFSTTYVDRDHTDRNDAFVIADRGRMGRDVPPPDHLDERYLAVRLLTRYRFHVVHALAREKASALAIRSLKASAYRHLKPVSNLFGVASRAVLQEFSSLEAIAAMPVDELVAWIDQQGKHRCADPQDTARTLQQVAQNSYVLPPALQQPVHQILRWNRQHLTCLEGQVKRLDPASAAHLAAIPHSLETIPSIGPVFAGGMVAEVGDLARFQYDEATIAKFAGCKWRKHQSGDFTAEETRLTRTGNR